MPRRSNIIPLQPIYYKLPEHIPRDRAHRQTPSNNWNNKCECSWKNNIHNY